MQFESLNLFTFLLRGSLSRFEGSRIENWKSTESLLNYYHQTYHYVSAMRTSLLVTLIERLLGILKLASHCKSWGLASQLL